jgi:hypothetical protein
MLVKKVSGLLRGTEEPEPRYPGGIPRDQIHHGVPGGPQFEGPVPKRDSFTMGQRRRSHSFSTLEATYNRQGCIVQYNQVITSSHERNVRKQPQVIYAPMQAIFDTLPAGRLPKESFPSSVVFPSDSPLIKQNMLAHDRSRTPDTASIYSQNSTTHSAGTSTAVDHDANVEKGMYFYLEAETSVGRPESAFMSPFETTLERRYAIKKSLDMPPAQARPPPPPHSQTMPVRPPTPLGQTQPLKLKLKPRSQGYSNRSPQSQQQHIRPGLSHASTSPAHLQQVSSSHFRQHSEQVRPTPPPPQPLGLPGEPGSAPLRRSLSVQEKSWYKPAPQPQRSVLQRTPPVQGPRSIPGPLARKLEECKVSEKKAAQSSLSPAMRRQEDIPDRLEPYPLRLHNPFMSSRRATPSMASESTDSPSTPIAPRVPTPPPKPFATLHNPLPKVKPLTRETLPLQQSSAMRSLRDAGDAVLTAARPVYGQAAEIVMPAGGGQSRRREHARAPLSEQRGQYSEALGTENIRRRREEDTRRQRRPGDHGTQFHGPF